MSPRFQQPVYSLAHFRALFPAKVEAALRPWAHSRYKISKRKTKLVMLWLIFCSCRCDWLINSGPLSQPVLDGSRTTPSCEFFLSSPLRLLESPSYFSRVLIDRCILCGFTSCTLKLVYCQQERVILMVDSANGSTYPWVMSLTGRWTVVKRVRCWLVRQRITQATKVWSASYIMTNWKIKKGPLKLIMKTSRVLHHWRSIKWNGAVVRPFTVPYFSIRSS